MLTRTSTLAQAPPGPNPRRTTEGGVVTQSGNSVSTAGAPKNDNLALSQSSQTRNPYQGAAPGFSTVKVDPWGKGKNDSVAQILLNQGFTQQEIYGKGGNGKTLLEEVTRVNRLRNANIIRAGQDLIVPSKQAPEQVETPTQPERTEGPTQPERTEGPTQPERTEGPTQPERTEGPTQPERTEGATQPERTEGPTQPEQPEAKVNEVKVDRWGKGPNSSLGAILRNQGFSDQQIFAEDAQGDSLLKKVARANGLESPDKIYAGSTLNVPNSMEALEKMEIPEMPARQEPTSPPERVETGSSEPVQTGQPEPENKPEDRRPPDDGAGEPTANMGMLLDGIKSGDFNRQEFQYLNARSSRYAQMRARFSNDGYDNDELKELGRMEQRYGVEFARLSASDDVNLPVFPQNSNNADLAIQVKHYHESGPLFDNYANGSVSSETAIQRMVRQREEARRQEVQ